MTLRENTLLAFKAIKDNWLRTVLTCTIIAFGIMALVCILTAIDALKSSLSNDFASLGSNTYNVIPKGTGLKAGGGRRVRNEVGPSITFNQAIKFKERFSFPAVVSVSAMGTSSGLITNGEKETNPNMVVYGADENYLSAAGYELALGRNFTAAEVRDGRQMALIGTDVVKMLFDDNTEKAMEGTIKIRGLSYKVIGVLASKGSSMSFSGDKLVILPLQLVRQKFMSSGDNYNISVQVLDSEQMDLAIAETIGMFRGIRKMEIGEENDFEVQKSDGLLNIILENTVYIRGAAIFIGLITLLGAAIGLMNIMLVSVTERTREIGICKSIGANSRTILTQFLMEAIVICQIGGIMGVILGILLGNVVSLLLGSAFVIPWAWIVLGLVLCLITGLVAGLYPAVKAAQLDPIDALRYE